MRLVKTSLRVGFVGAFILLFFLLPSFATLYTDWLWFGELGYQQIFVRVLSARLLLGAATFALVFGVLFLNIYIARAAVRTRQFMTLGPQGLRTITIDLRRLQPLFYIGAA